MAEGKYVIIASTFEPGTKGKYRLLVYAEDQESVVEPLTSEWKFKQDEINRAKEFAALLNRSESLDGEVKLEKVYDQPARERIDF